MKIANEPNFFSSDHLHFKWQWWLINLSSLLSGVKSRTRSTGQGWLKRPLVRVIRQVPCSLGSPLQSLASFTYPALETCQLCGCTIQNLFRERTAHCISNFCEPVSSFSFNCITIDLSRLFSASSVIFVLHQFYRDIP
jgi:hypothetical protein